MEPVAIDQQLAIIQQNTETFIGASDLKEKLASGTPLRIKLGVDPTRPDLTFGHWVVFNKLRQLQSLGHHIIFVIGDYTTRIGDPSGRSSTRPVLTVEQIEANSQTYLDQAFKILDPQKTETRRNSEWFEKMSFGDLLSLTRQVTVAQLLEREDFNKRYTANTPIALVEFLYPVLQAYDSIVLQSDIELGGADQLFNLCLGRQFQKCFGQNPQAVLCMPLLVGLDGVKKMSKSFGNYITFNDTSTDMYGKIMSIPDNTMWDYFKLLLLESTEKVEERKQQSPMAMKKELAYNVVTRFFSESIAQDEQKHFETVFSHNAIPDDMPEFTVDRFAQCKTWVDVIVATNLYHGSKKELKRLIEQGGVEINQERISQPQAPAQLTTPSIVRVGKRLFFKISV